MSFLLLIFLIILIMFVWPLIRVVFTVNRMRKKAADAFRQATGRQGADGTYSRQTDNRRRGGWHAPQHPKKKVFTRDMGEYVSWEEVETATTQQTTSQNGETRRQTAYRREDQITDVEWEEV